MATNLHFCESCDNMGNLRTYVRILNWSKMVTSPSPSCSILGKLHSRSLEPISWGLSSWYNASSRDDLENTPPMDLKLCLEGCIFKYIPPLAMYYFTIILPGLAGQDGGRDSAFWFPPSPPHLQTSPTSEGAENTIVQVFEIVTKHRKNCECCPGHSDCQSLTVNVMILVSQSVRLVNFVTKSLIH